MTHDDWISLASPLIDIGLAGAAGLFGWAWWSMRRVMATKTELACHIAQHGSVHDDLDGRLAAGEARFAKLEATLANMPSKDEVNALKVEMARLSGDIRVATAVLQRVEEPVRALTSGALAEVVK